MRRQLMAGLLIAWLANAIVFVEELWPGGVMHAYQAPPQFAALVVVGGAFWIVWKRPRLDENEGEDDGGSATQ
jgi:hypothetical protein